MTGLIEQITEIDKALDEAVALLRRFDSYNEKEAADAEAHAAVREMLGISRSAVERIHAAQEVLAGMRDPIIEVDETLNEVLEADLGLFDSYDESEATATYARSAMREMPRIARIAIEMILGAQHVLAMIRDKASRG